MNVLTSFSGAGFTTALKTLDLTNNQLSALSGTGLNGLTVLKISNNKLASLAPNITGLTSIPANTAELGNNCLVAGSLSSSLITWLDAKSVASPLWSVQNSTYCPAASTPQTMWFFGTDGNWNNTSNWYSNVGLTTGISPKIRPDASNNVIILSNVSQNSTYNLNPPVQAIVKTLQVTGNTIISIPIRNGGGYTYTTNLPGDYNDITWTSSDPAVTITYATPVEQAQTTVEVNGKNIVITPGTKARMDSSG
jgi:Leucine-rich repeat (LRR) protein